MQTNYFFLCLELPSFRCVSFLSLVCFKYVSLDSLVWFAKMIPSLLSEGFPVVICLLFLAYASWLDKRMGLVSNKFWIMALVTGGLTSFLDYVTQGVITIIGNLLFSLPLTLLLSLMLFRLKVFCGSDSKALICLSLYVPTLTPLIETSSLSLLTSLSTVVNFLILLSLLISLNFIRNSIMFLQHADGVLISEITFSRKLLIMTVFRKKHILCPLSKGSLWSPLIPSAPEVSSSRTTGASFSNQSGQRIPEDDPSVVHTVESWAPLRIPLVLILTVSFVISLVIGDISSYLFV